MATKKTVAKTFTRTPEQQELDRLKRLERTLKRDPTSISSSTLDSNATSSSSGRDFLDGFEQSIGLFGDSQVANGEAGQIFDYQHGVLQLHLANVAGGVVKLMSHYVWNAALVMAEYIEAGDVVDVRGKRVIEFGAGAALPGLLCIKRGGAQFVTLTDYPDPAIVQNLERNWFENLVETQEDKNIRRISGNLASMDTASYKDIVTPAPFVKGCRRDYEEQRVKCAVRGHAWGGSVQEMLDCLPSSSASETAASTEAETGTGTGTSTGAALAGTTTTNNDQRYDWILLADTLWVSEGHADLLKSCLAVLRDDGHGKIFVCCGLHSGYNTVQRFLQLATSPVFGLQSRLVEIRRMPVWGETRSAEELRRESELLREEDLKRFETEDRNRTVLVYELWR
ncbi:hypothetical protein BGZ95_002949 [Linnemannia exigua]|uniref:Nicotinamide N-methyltransferase n=1 Tax=Linnemannia exigua TaxID=604196 RepID=A0AAD4H1P9_9FUNG|nr:hypothetical protein BGZ95_002949 [Linnemannia exigua]